MNYDISVDELPNIDLSPNAQVVLEKRYLKRDSEDVQETPKQMFWRVASNIASEEQKYQGSVYDPQELAKDFYNLMASLDFLPNSPTLMNAGTGIGQLAACFVLPVEDSLDKIFDSIKHAALIHKSGGGTGFSFSKLRPKNSKVGSTGGIASGPLSFLKIFNTATEQVKQGGTRRGANMGVLRVDHPDILEFIKSKEHEDQLNNFNLSVALTEQFMDAVEDDTEYSLIDPHSGEVTEKLRAMEVFGLLVRKAWESGDPGMIFIDKINRDNPTPKQGEIESTNPCGEQPLLPYEACNLGSINLANFCSPDQKNGVDWDRLREVIHLSIRFLDNVIDSSDYPLDEINQKVIENRKVGLGIMGWADLLYSLELPYNSQRALSLAEVLMEFFQQESKAASRILAQEKGAFPAFDDSVYAENGEGPYRNATTTTIAPTGTLSIIAGCSSGIEPLFALSFVRQVMDGEKLSELNSYFKQYFENTEYYTPDRLQEIASKGTIRDLEYMPKRMKEIFVTSMDIEPDWHLNMQAAFQKHTDNAVSKTVNLPNSATQDDIYNVYWKAHELGCKGVTVFRDGSKSEQVLTKSTESKQDTSTQDSVVKERPEVMFGFTQKVETGLGELYLTINEIDGKPFEVFATIGKSGRSITAKTEAIGRLVSLALRSGVYVKDIVKQLKGIGGEHPVFKKKGLLLSIPDAVAWVLENRYLQGEEPQTDSKSLVSPHCPECGQELVFQEGCFLCYACGYTKCG